MAAGGFPSGSGVAPAEFGWARGIVCFGPCSAAGLRGQSVVLMQPTLPLGLFDLCVIEHDAPAAGECGADPRGVESDRARAGCIFTGGPVSDWRAIQTSWMGYGSVVGRSSRVLAADPLVHWTLTTSRRTPQACAATVCAGSSESVSGAAGADAARLGCQPIAALW